MTDIEIIDWLRLLADTNAKRRTLIHDIIKHSAEDRLSAEDVVACRRALTLMAEGVVVDRKPRFTFTEEQLWESSETHDGRVSEWALSSIRK